MNIFELDAWCLEHAKSLPVPVCKGESKQQMATNNAVAAQQLASQQAQLAQYNNYVKQLTAGGGYLPGVKQALDSNAIQSVPLNYQQAASQIMSNLGSRGAAGGGSEPGSGLYGRNLGALYSSEEQNKSNLLNNITAGGQQNISAAEGGVLQGAGINSQAGSNALTGATSAANQANQQSGILGTIIGGGLGVLGQAVGKGGALAGCWVAAELYGGWFAPEAVLLRSWIFGTWYMRPFALIYSTCGMYWAGFIKRNNSGRKLTKRLFDWFLRKAHGR
jgi:hypothetical protein